MSDLISRQAAIDAMAELQGRASTKAELKRISKALKRIKQLPSAQPQDIARDISRIIENEKDMRVISKNAQPEIIRCKDCIYYNPPHVENNGVRYEYDEMPADAFDALGTGLVNAEYGINIGGRCCVDYYCKNYSDDKRVFVREDNYCGRAERRTDGSD